MPLKVRYPLLGLVSFVILLVSSCRVKQPVYKTVENFKLGSIGLASSTLKADAIFYNPNNFGVMLNDANGDIYIDSVYLGKFRLDKKIKVNGKSDFSIPVSVEANTGILLTQYRVLTEGRPFYLKINGVAKASKSGVNKTFVINYEGVQSLDSLVKEN